MQLKTTNPQSYRMVANYTILTNQILGKGATGIVYKGFHNLTKQYVAIKTIDLSTIKDQATHSLLENQKMALRSIKSTSVIRLQDIIEDQGFCYIITQLCQGTTLKEYLNKQIILAEPQAMAIFRKLVSGCQAIASQCIIHRDLKPANVMIDSKGDVKIIDFGYCEIIMAKKVMKTFNVGSPSYMSPEAYLRTLYSQKSDAWALGMILYEMLHGHTLDNRMQTKQYFEQLKSDPQFVSKKISHNYINLQIKQIIEKALKYIPQNRLTISSLKYQADLYHVNQKQKNVNQPPLPPTTNINPFIDHTPKIKHKLSFSIERVNTQNQNKTKGFVSFADFNRHQPKGHQIKIKPMTSLSNFDSNSEKNGSPTKSRGVAMDEKLSNFLKNTVKQPRIQRPGSSNTLQPACRTMVVSSKQIPSLPPRPPLNRHVTLHFN